MTDPCREIELTRGFVAKVDECDLELLSGRHWIATVGQSGKPYATSGWGDDRRIMHRMIVNAPDGMLVDHINGDTLDNRKENLRICTPSENIRNSKRRSTNTSGFKGVNFQCGKWMARIMIHQKRYNLGLFDTPEEAHKAYCDKAKELHGEYARFE